MGDKLKDRDNVSSHLRPKRWQSLAAAPYAQPRLIPRPSASGRKSPPRSTTANSKNDADDSRSETGSTHTSAQASSRPSTPGSISDGPSSVAGDRTSLTRAGRSNSLDRKSVV